MRYSVFILLIAFAVCTVPASPAHALFGWFEDEEKKAESRPYQIHFSEETEAEEADMLRPAMAEALDANRNAMAQSEVELTPRSAVRVERELLERLLHAEGYYDAALASEIKGEVVHYSITTGPRYTVREFTLNAPEGIKLPNKNTLPLAEDKPLRAEAVLESQKQVKEFIEKNHCLFEVKVDYRVWVYHETAEAEVLLSVQDSPETTFAEAQVTGNKTVEEPFIRRKITFEDGACFKRKKIENSRLQMFQTGLFGTVETKAEQTEKGAVVTFNVTERKHRTIKAGAGFSSDEGFGVTGGWEHRNFFGEGEKLQVDAGISQLTQNVEFTLSYPAFLDNPKQTLTLGGGLTQEMPDAYEATSIGFNVGLKRNLTEHVTGSIGTELEVSNVTDNAGREDTFTLLSFPIGLSFDNRDSVLNPKKGIYLSGEVRPFFDLLKQDSNFIKTSLGASGYYTLEDLKYSPTFAVRSAFGSIQGVGTGSIPADKRFYSGGGGSVRGYGYQELGPLNANGEPIGGRSLAELSFETRLQFSESWGGVVFVDGGNAYDDYVPDFGDGLQWATGFGVRYYTSFAPIRADIAFPLERRDGIDDAFQFYISIGQAF